MRKTLCILLILFSITSSIAQIQSNRHARITEQEFNELLSYRDEFVPNDLGDTVIIVKYVGSKLLAMQDEARNIGFAKYGTDTTGLRIGSLTTERSVEKSRIQADKFSHSYPEKLKKKLKRNGIESLIVNESDLKANTKHANKFWLKTVYISSQNSPQDNGWVMTVTNTFYDPRTNKDFKAFLPVNYSLFDFIRKR